MEVIGPGRVPSCACLAVDARDTAGEDGSEEWGGKTGRGTDGLDRGSEEQSQC